MKLFIWFMNFFKKPYIYRELNKNPANEFAYTCDCECEVGSNDFDKWANNQMLIKTQSPNEECFDSRHQREFKSRIQQ